MKQVKPVIVGCLNTCYAGKNCNDKRVYTVEDCKIIAGNDAYLRRVGASSNVRKLPKFRPVYAKG